MIFGKKVGAKDAETYGPPGGHFGIGQCFEGAVARYLTVQGYELLFRNYRVKGGEIDLIMKKNDILAFIEVKAREESDNLRKYGRPSDAVDYRKRAHIITAADDYFEINRKRTCSDDQFGGNNRLCAGSRRDRRH